MFRKTSLIGWLCALGVVLVFYSCYGADEVEVRAAINFAPDNAPRIDTTTVKFDVSGALTTSGGRQTIDTGAWESITISADISTNGYAFFKNTTTTAGSFIEIATAQATNVFIKLLPNEFALFPMNTNSLVAKATTANCILHKFIINR